jgi:adenylate cyclase
MSKRVRQILLGIFTGLLGCCIYLLPQGWQLEEKYGLHWLFHLRGAIPPPDEVIVIAIDRPSASQLGLPVSPNFWPWPRDIHARLIEHLAHAGAQVIVLDLIFHTPGAIPGHDKQLAEAIKNAGNVVIVERLHSESFNLIDNRTDAFQFKLIKEESIPLLPELADAVFAHAPFPLPDKPRINAYWTFRPGMGDAPTIPAIVFQTYALRIYDDLMELLHTIQAPDIDKLPQHRHLVNNIETVIFFLRQLFIDHPDIRQRIISELYASRLDDRKKQLIASLMNVYASDGAHYLNFYGPPHSIRTIPYYQIMQSAEGGEVSLNALRAKIAGKVIFVGLSATTQSENELIRDAYHTVFTDSEGVKISGVEIAATAFANLLENKPVKPFSYGGSLGLLFIMGLILGTILPALTNRALVAISLLLAGIYTLFAGLVFTQAGIWLPLITPLFIVIPGAAAGAVFLKYLAARQERDQLLTLFGQFTPGRIVADMTRHMDSIRHKDQLVFGACLLTDVEGYTALAEEMDVRQLKVLLDDYFAILSRSVQENHGVVSEKTGDAMLAIWEAATASRTLREQACAAGLAILDNVYQFNAEGNHPAMPTRIGIHFGELLISKFDAGKRENYIYRTVGDLVNTTSRIEAINKRLGTRLLVTHEVLDGISHFLTRPLGDFQFAGKSLPIQLHELIAHKQAASEKQILLCEMFAAALAAYTQQRIDAIEKWQDILTFFPNDGPTRFYLDICRQSPPQQWNPVIRLSEKS